MIIMKNQSVADIQRHYRRLNRLFWLGVWGIILFPILMLIVAAIAFRVAGSEVSAPIGLSSPLGAVAAIALALLVRSSRRIARRSLDLGKWAESQGYQYCWKPAEEEWQLIGKLSVWDNPTSMEARNLIRFEQSDVATQIADFRSEHFYGAVTSWSEQTLIVFPNAVDEDLDLIVIPKGTADKLLGKLVNTGVDQRFHQLPLAKNFQIACSGSFDTAELQKCLVALQPVLQQFPRMCLIVENGHVVLFQELRLLSVADTRPMLAASWTACQCLAGLEST
jgi:hypothetical protein